MIKPRGRLGFAALGLVASLGCFGRKSSGPVGGGVPCTTAATDCATGQYCVSGYCADPGTSLAGDRCVATRSCAPGLYCNPIGYCAPGGQVSEGGSCTADAVCVAPLRCNLAGFYGVCGAPGTADSGAACASSASCVSGLVCSPQKTCLAPKVAYPPFAGVTCTDEGPFRVYFEIPRPSAPPKDFFRLPFPNDIRVTGGKLDLSDFPKPGPTPLGIDLVQLYVDTWTADFDGFSSIGVTTFRFSGEIDDTTVGGDETRIVDLTTGAAYSRNWSYGTARTKYTCANRFVERNTTDAPFIGGHTYAVILTTGIKSKTGETLTVDPDMAALLAVAPPAAADPALVHAWTVYQPLRDWLGAKGATAPSVAAAAVFTVQDAPGHMQRLATAVAKEPPPVFKDVTVCAAGVKSPCDDGTPARACPATPDATFDEIHGRFSVPIFQKGAEPYEQPADGAGGIVEEAGVAKVQRTEDVCFALSVPKGTAPPGGWPLMVYHHGTGGSMRSFVDDLAKPMATGATPSAVFGWDAVEHGARKGGSTKKSDDLVFNPLNPRAARDNLLQGAVDVLQAFRVGGATIALPNGAMVPLGTKVTYFGHSQGSTSGALAVSVSDAAPAAVFSGAGSFLTHSLLDKTNPVNIAAGMVYLIGEPLDDQHPVLTLFQSFFDRSDPLNYNPLIINRPPMGLHGKHIYMSWGSNDTYTPASTLNANGMSFGTNIKLPRPGPGAPFMFAAGLPVGGAVPAGYGGTVATRPVSLNVESGDAALTKVTAVMVPYQSASTYDGHFVATKNPSAIADWSAFVQSYLKDGAPTLP
ncbi:MAG: hypothetical protein JWM82_2773 [Myxococcales bacterium]|nr:hypothetical protein [Myxococcales bacterium]